MEITFRPGAIRAARSKADLDNCHAFIAPRHSLADGDETAARYKWIVTSGSFINSAPSGDWCNLGFNEDRSRVKPLLLFAARALVLGQRTKTGKRHWHIRGQWPISA
jgi:hypothetical protein